MIIHLIGSMRDFEDDVLLMNAINDVIANHDSQVALNWIDSVKGRKSRQIQAEDKLNWGEIVDENVRAIEESDALIVEGSRFNYSQGYQTALALAHNKPVLNLYRDDLPEYKDWPDKFFVSGVSHPLFTSKAYKDEKDLKKIVDKFLKDHAKRAHELDMKLALDSSVYEKLEKIAQASGKSKASVIKDIVTQNISHK